MRQSLHCRLGLVVLACALIGCKNYSVSEYVSPRVTGRVLDAQTHLPLAKVEVRRVGQATIANGGDQPKGGQIMQEPAPILTDSQGAFVVDSQRALALFRHLGWYSITLSFDRYGYAKFVNSYTVAESTNTATGEPLVQTGDVFLQPNPQ
jgi:hypothetical protein